MESRGDQIVRALGVFNDGGADGFLGHLAERDLLGADFTMTIQRDGINGGVWRGPEGFREMARIWLEPWEVFELHPREPIELDPDRFVVPTLQRAVASGAGMELDEVFFYTVEFDGGRWAAMGLFADRERAESFLTKGEA